MNININLDDEIMQEVAVRVLLNLAKDKSYKDTIRDKIYAVVELLNKQSLKAWMLKR